jgi:hypothetical protein
MVDAGTGLTRLRIHQAHRIPTFVKNRSVYGHKESEGRVLVLSVCIGKFEGADFCVPELDHRLRFRSGDFMGMDFPMPTR